VAAFAAVATALLASCGLLHASSKPWWYQTGCLSGNREIRGSCPVIEVAVVP